MSFYDDASLIMYPSGYKEDKIYSLKPTDGSGDLTFTRASTATRVNAEGLIEEVPYNLLTYSEQFDNAAWTKVRGSITANSTTAPNGTTTADTFTCGETSTNGCFTRQTTTLTNERTTSIYVKPNTCTFFQIHRDYGDGVVFNLNNGTVKEAVNASGVITDVGGGWYRCSATFSNTGSSLFIFGNLNMTVLSWESTINENCFIWGAQLNIGSTAKTYFPTTDRLNVPRIDYTGGGCGKLLLEPQRTNLVTYSEDFFGWSNKANVTITSNYTTSPEGVQNASRALFNANGFLLNLGYPTQIAGTQYTLSCYAKRNGIGTQSFGFFKDGSGSVDSAMALTSEWKRFDYTYTAANNSQIGLAGLNGADVSIYGFQAEQGSYATSYIPTSGATVTRLADAVSKTGISSLIGQTEGTIFVDFQFNQSTSDSNGRLLQLWATNSTTNSILPLINQSNQFQLSFFNSGSGAAIIPASASTLIGFGQNKIAIAYTSTTALVYRNGVLFATGNPTGFFPTSLNSLDLGGSSSQADRKLENPINQAMLFKTALSNAELETLTTL